MSEMEVTCPGCGTTVGVDLRLEPGFLTSHPGAYKWGNLVGHNMPIVHPWSRPHANAFVSGLAISGPPCLWSGSRVNVELNRLNAEPPKPVVK